MDDTTTSEVNKLFEELCKELLDSGVREKKVSLQPAKRFPFSQTLDVQQKKNVIKSLLIKLREEFDCPVTMMRASNSGQIGLNKYSNANGPPNDPCDGNREYLESLGVALSFIGPLKSNREATWAEQNPWYFVVAVGPSPYGEVSRVYCGDPRIEKGKPKWRYMMTNDRRKESLQYFVTRERGVNLPKTYEEVVQQAAISAAKSSLPFPIRVFNRCMRFFRSSNHKSYDLPPAYNEIKK